MRTEIAGRLQSEDPVTLNSYGVDSCGFYSLRFRVHDRSGAPVSSSVSGCWGQVLFLASAEQRGHLNNVDTHNRGHPSSRIGSPLRAPIFKMLGVHCQTYSGPQFPNDAGHPLSNPPLSKSLEKQINRCHLQQHSGETRFPSRRWSQSLQQVGGRGRLPAEREFLLARQALEPVLGLQRC